MFLFVCGCFYGLPCTHTHSLQTWYTYRYTYSLHILYAEPYNKINITTPFHRINKGWKIMKSFYYMEKCGFTKLIWFLKNIHNKRCSKKKKGNLQLKWVWSPCKITLNLWYKLTKDCIICKFSSNNLKFYFSTAIS